jgi:GxxExxY protein
MVIKKKSELIYPQLSYKIYGLCYKVHNQLGRFRNEKQYADAFEQLLKENDVVYKRENPIPLSFRGEKPRRSIPDFVIEDKVVVDFKVKRIVTKEDYYQMKRYL